MGRRDHVKLSDVREVMRLVAGCEQRWDDAGAWRRHLLRGMRQLFQTQVAMYVEGAGVDDRGKPYHLEMATAGWPSPRARRKFMDYLDRGGPAIMLDFPVIARRLAEQGRYVGRRRDQIADRHWYASTAYLEFHAPIGFDDYLVSMRLMPKLGTVSSISLHRRDDEPPLSVRHRRLLALLHGELTPRLGTTLCLQRQRGLHGLTKRQRQTLRLLARGDSEKQIAQRLDLSPTTVHGYVRELHRYFQVRSRGELLSYLLHRIPRPEIAELREALSDQASEAGDS